MHDGAREAAFSWIWGGALATLLALVSCMAPWRLIAELVGASKARRCVVWLLVVGLAASWSTYALAERLLGPWTGCLLAAGAGALACMAYIDLRWLIVPDAHVCVLLLIALFRPLGLSWLSVFSGAALGAGLLLAVRWSYLRMRHIEALGLGDVKLIAALGALAGPRSVLWIIVAASAMGVLLALTLNRGRFRRAQPLPFGALAAIPAVIVAALALTGP